MTGASPMGAAGRRMMHQDASMADKKLAPGTIRRVVSFARPYRKELAVFLVLTIISSVIGVATPLLAGEVVNQISFERHRQGGLLIAAVIAGLAVLDALLSLATRWYSSRIGEGLIFDMRTKVFQHVQQMSLAFFTRTQTGALVSRLNNDVIGAQQAFTSTLSGRRVQRHRADPDVGGDVHPVLAGDDPVVDPAADLRAAGALVRPEAAGDDQGELPAQRLDEHHHHRAVQRLRRAAGDAVRAPGGRGRLLPRPCRPGEGHRGGHCDVRAGVPGRARPGRGVGLRAHLRSGRHARISTMHIEPGAVVSLALLLSRLYGPLTALSNVRVDVM